MGETTDDMFKALPEQWERGAPIGGTLTLAF